MSEPSPLAKDLQIRERTSFYTARIRRADTAHPFDPDPPFVLLWTDATAFNVPDCLLGLDTCTVTVSFD